MPNRALIFSTAILSTIPSPTPSTSSAPTNRRTSALYTVPNDSAITVLVRIITLYGMLKSGVGSGSIKLVVLKYAGLLLLLSPLSSSPPFPFISVPATVLLLLASPSSKIRITAGGTSLPLFASGGYSVYLRIAFSNSYANSTVELACTRTNNSICEPLFRSRPGR